MIKQTDAVLQAWLARAIALGGPYDPAALFLGVATAAVDNGAATVQADITEATGAMATRIAVTPWGAPYKLADGRWVADGPVCNFSPLNETEAQVLNWWFLNGAAAAGVLKAFAAISPGKSMNDENSNLAVIPRLTIDPEGRFSAEVIFSS